MNSIFISRQLSFLFKIIIFTIVLFGVHSYLSYYFIEQATFFPLWHIYTLLFILTGIFYSIINYQHSKGATLIFNLFIGATLSKMILAIIFLLPLLLSSIENKKIDVLNFFIPYFLYLFFEVLTINSFLQKK